jgi:hypothetical protein
MDAFVEAANSSIPASAALTASSLATTFEVPPLMVT